MNEYERRSITFTLYFFLGIASLVSMIILISSLFVEEIDILNVRAAGAALLICLLMLWLTGRKKILIPRLVIPFVAFGLAIYLVSSALGVHDEAITLFPLAIALAGLLLGRVGIIVYGVAGVVAVFWLAFAEYRGDFVTPFSAVTNEITMITVPTLLGLTSMMIYLMVNYLSTALVRSQISQEELEKRNADLQALQSSLSQQVTERTRHAEQARQDAETARQSAEDANRALEIQMWQVAGQAQLNECLRGDQNLETLADGIVGFLCRYLRLSVGVLYVRNGQRLHLAGGYAHPPSLPTAFDVDEGLLGRAVIEKRLVLVSQPADVHINVTSALGQMVPTHVVIVPLIEADKVLGVIELGAFDPFAERAVQFLEHAAESIAIALRSAQTRIQLNELFEETQRQAEELQAQEEELRAANEELLARSELYKRASS